MKRARRWWLILAAIGLLAAGGFFVWRGVAARNPWTEERTAVVERGTLEVVVNASGRIEPIRQVDLSFSTPGRVAEVAVDIGDEVRAGQVLARLDTGDLELNLRQAEATLKSAQAQLAQLRAQPRPETLKAAEAAYRSALAQYQRLKNSPSPEEKAVAEANLKRAEVMLHRARAAYEPVSWRPDIGMLPQSLNLETATLDYQIALANYQLTTKGASAEDLAAAWSNVESARAQLERAVNGPTQEELAVAEAAVEQARAACEAARRNLEKATLTAPFDGLIAAVNVAPGEMAPTGLPAVSVVDTSGFRITVNVDEMDVARLQVGLPAEVTLDALPEVTLTGRVERIGPSATLMEGAMTYPVVIGLDPTDAPVRAGMSANVLIRVEELTDQLLIPNWIVRIDPTTGQPYVYRKTASGNLERVDVRLGVRYEGYSQVLSGLNEGDILVLVRENPSGQFGFPFGR
ncbi:MAG: efflux RND transporter periplasmic adaptor subunit [Anaerolineae bacterium]|nr:efflux RND transporter periplasmic adaptor subunit [Anaerolineae bacterium]MDW8069631.1 efflux RND transporter periplasmic adaptor subunit [Anaerolineae bacterium]